MRAMRVHAPRAPLSLDTLPDSLRPYELPWGERRVESVANLTRADAERFMALAARIQIRTEVREYPLERASEALEDLRHGRFSGAAVLVP